MTLNKFSFLLLSYVTLTATLPAVAQENFTDDQKKQIGEVVKDYLLQHPEVIKESIMNLQKKEMQAMEDSAKSAAFAEKDELMSDKSPHAGAKSPKEVMVMFFDYQCPHCKHMAAFIDPLLSANKDLKIIYKELPIFGGTSLVAAQAALAANKQGKYPQFYQKLMSVNDNLDENKIMALAKELGLDSKKLKVDMASPEINKEIQDNVQLAQKIGVRGTPAFFISPYPATTQDKLVFIPGEVSQEQLQSSIDKLKSQQ